MSYEVCKQRGIRLPDNETCGTLCEGFPGCLPPLPPDSPRILGEVIRLLARCQAATAVAELLGNSQDSAQGEPGEVAEDHWEDHGADLHASEGYRAGWEAHLDAAIDAGGEDTDLIGGGTPP